MTESQRWKQYQRLANRVRKAAKRDPQSKMMIGVTMMSDVIKDDRFGDVALDFVWKAFLTATNQTDDRLTCFCCCQEWADDRHPIGGLTVEFLNLPNEGIFAGICEECMAKGQSEFMKAVKRDFPMMTDVRTVSAPGRA